MPYDKQSDIADDALLKLYANGDEVAAQVLTLRLTPRVFSQAFRMLGDRDEAEDVTQEALIRLWKVAPDWRQGEAKVTTWLYRVVANLCKDQMRKVRGLRLDVISEPADSTLGPVVQMQERARSNALQAALATLPARQRQAVVLRHIEGLGNPEIADILNVSVEAVESLTARGKRMLIKVLADQKEVLGFSDD